MNLDDLRKIAENATPGPWITGGELQGSDGVFFGTAVDPDDPDEPGILLGEAFAPDAEFIATFNPELVVALLDRVEKAEAELGRYVHRLERTENEYNRLETSHSILEAALQRVRELHAKHENTIHTRPEWVCAHRHCVDDSMDQNAWPCPTIRALEGDE